MELLQEPQLTLWVSIAASAFTGYEFAYGVVVLLGYCWYAVPARLFGLLFPGTLEALISKEPKPSVSPF